MKRQRTSPGQIDEDARESAGLLLGLLMDSPTEAAPSRPMPQLMPQPHPVPMPMPMPMPHLQAPAQSTYGCSDMHATPEGVARVPFAGMPRVSAVNPLPRSAGALAADDHTYEGLL